MSKQRSYGKTYFLDDFYLEVVEAEDGQQILIKQVETIRHITDGEVKVETEEYSIEVPKDNLGDLIEILEKAKAAWEKSLRT